MKWTMMLTEHQTQFNLVAETKAEEELCKILQKFDNGTLSIHQGANIGPNQAGYLRIWSEEDRACAITLSKPKPATLPAEE